jgi:hypothetical protein
MVLKYITKGGSRIYGPPYTKAEQADLYRRMPAVQLLLPELMTKRPIKSAKKRTNKTRP